MPLLYTEHSLDFDGTNDYVALGDVAELSFERTDPFSVSAWIKIPSSETTGAFILSKNAGAPTFRGWSFGTTAAFGGRLNFYLVSTTGTNEVNVYAGPTMWDDRWHHVVVTYDGSSNTSGISIYVDSELQSNTVINNNLSATAVTTAGAAIGNRNSTTVSGPLEGRIAEVAVYDTEISLSDVVTIYNAGSPPDLMLAGPTGDLVGYWRLGEHSFPTVPDLSASGNDGTMTNMATDDIVVDAPRPHEALYSIELQENLSQYITMGYVSEVAFAHTDSFSLSIWVKSLSGRDPDGYLMSQIDATGDFRGWGFIQLNGNLRCILYNDGVLNGIEVRTTSFDLLDGEWHHCVLTYDGSVDASGVSYYVDGVEETSYDIVQNNLSGTLFENAAPLNINARQNGGAPAAGYYTEASIWSKELSSLEVAALYNSGVPLDARTLGINSDLQGYWVIDRESYPTVEDLSLNANPGTATNTAALDISLEAPGVDFSSAEFGTNVTAFEGLGWVDMGDVLDFETTDPFSLCIFARAASGVQSVLIAKEEGSGFFEGYFFVLTSAGDLVFRFEGNGANNNKIEVVTNLSSFGDDTWRLFAVTYDGSGDAAGVTLYVDGVSVPYSVSANSLSNSTVNAAPFQIGNRDTNSTPLDGAVAWASVYSKELTEAEMRTLFNERKSSNLLETMPLGNLEGYWRMGDGDTFPTITDHSGNGFDGDMVGYLHQERLINSRPPGASSTQFANGLYGAGEVADASLQPGRDDAFSISCWFKTNSPVNEYPAIVRQYDGDLERGIILGIEGFSSWTPGSVHFVLTHDNGANDEIQVNTTSAYNDGVWRHLTCTYDGSALASGCAIYIDGSPVAVTVRRNLLGADDFLNTAPFEILDAANTDNTTTEGAVCQVAFYNKELTAGEVTAIYGAGTPPDLSSVGPTGNLVAWWPITQSDLGTSALADLSGNSLDMTLQDTTSSIVEESPAPLESVYALDFDGANDHVLLGDLALFSFERTDPFTLSVWVRPDNISGDRALLCKQVNPGGRGWQLGITSGFPFLILTSTTVTNEIIVVVSDSPLFVGYWHHLVLTYDGSSEAAGVRVFVNNVERPLSVTQDSLSATTVNAESLAFGARIASSSDSFFDGRLDEVAIYDRVLSPSEIAVVHNSGGPVDHAAQGPLDSLIGWWRMGDPGPAVFPTIADASTVYDNPGTMTNMDAGDIVEAAIVFTTLYLDYVYTTTPIGPDLGTVGTLLSLLYVPVTEISDYYKMRALADPGPGYVTWVVDSLPDYTGTFAPASIQGGSAVVSDLWGNEDFIYSSVSTEKTLSTVSGPSVLVDPQGGLLFIGVDTSQVTWSDLDTITLPASSQIGSEILIKDVGGQADTKRITVNGNGNNIDGQATRLISNPQETLHVVYGGSQWSII